MWYYIIYKKTIIKLKWFISASFYLETCLLGRKGSIERTKTTLDKWCTLRTLLPQYFMDSNATWDFGKLFDFM